MLLSQDILDRFYAIMLGQKVIVARNGLQFVCSNVSYKIVSDDNTTNLSLN